MALKPGEPSLPSPPPRLSEHERKKWFGYFFFLVFAFVVYQLLRILAVFADPLIWAATLALLFYPLHARLRSRLPPSETLAAAATTACVLALVLLPLLLIGWVLVSQSDQLYPVARAWVLEAKGFPGGFAAGLLPGWALGPWERLVAAAERYGLLSGLREADLQALALRHLDTVSRRLADLGAAAAKNALALLFNLALSVVGLFFCFKDGEPLMRWLTEVLPMPPEHSRAIGLRVYKTLTAIVNAALITAAAQGLVAFIGYLIAGVPLSVLFGVLTGLAAMIPILGAALVWVPIGLFMMTQSAPWGVFLLVWGVGVSTMDNLLKPILIGAGTKTHILLMFLAIVGGLQVYGLTGLVLGPVMAACALACVKIYQEEYAAQHGG